MARLVDILQRHALLFSLLFYGIGVFWTFLHPLVNITSGELKPRGTFIAEKAVQTYIPTTAFSHSDVVHARGLYDTWAQYTKACNASAPLEASDIPAVSCVSPVDWLTHTCAHMGADVDVLPAPACGGDVVVCRVSARGGDVHKEALVLTSGYAAPGRLAGNDASMDAAFSLALLRVLASPRRVRWLVKDVLLVLTPASDSVAGGACAHDTFLNAYMFQHRGRAADVSNVSAARPLAFVSGPIRSAISLHTRRLPHDGEAAHSNTIHVHVHGQGSLLPELDFFTTVVRHMQPDLRVETHATFAHTSLARYGTALSRLLSLPPVLGIADAVVWGLSALSLPVSQNIRLHHVSAYCNSLARYFAFLVDMVRGATGAHAAYLSRGVPALTLSPQPSASSAEADDRMWAAFGRGMERVVRAMSGLDERLHASDSFYALIDAGTFVGLPEYAATAVPLHLPVLLLTLSRIPPRARVLGHAAALAVVSAVAHASVAMSKLSGALEDVFFTALQVSWVMSALLAALWAALDLGAPLDSVTARFVAWMAIGLPQLSLLYTDYALFLVTAFCAVPAMLFVEVVFTLTQVVERKWAEDAQLARIVSTGGTVATAAACAWVVFPLDSALRSVYASLPTAVVHWLVHSVACVSWVLVLQVMSKLQAQPN